MFSSDPAHVRELYPTRINPVFVVPELAGGFSLLEPTSNVSVGPVVPMPTLPLFKTVTKSPAVVEETWKISAKLPVVFQMSNLDRGFVVPMPTLPPFGFSNSGRLTDKSVGCWACNQTG